MMTLFLAVHFIIRSQSEEIPSYVYESFVHYTEDFAKSYANEQTKEIALQNYYENFKIIEKSLTNQTALYQVGLTEYSDISFANFQSQLLISLSQPSLSKGYKFYNSFPESLDWRTKHQTAISEFRSQLAFNASWAFAVVAAVESYHRINGVEVSLSVQQIIDCTAGPAWPEQVYQWIKANGLVLDEQYPYTATKGACKYPKGIYKINFFRGIRNGNVDQLKAALTFRPFTVCFDASQASLYTGGTFDGQCQSQTPNYCGLLVGFDTGSWVIKTSLSEKWGEKGYIKIKFGSCGVENFAVMPLLSENEDVSQAAVSDFQKYKIDFNKSYPAEEEGAKLHSFYGNWLHIKESNQVHAYKLGNTVYSDLDEEEFFEIYLLKGPLRKSLANAAMSLSITTPVASIDWRAKGIVSPVINSGPCSGSWAIAVANQIESMFRQQTTAQLVISPQQLIDCVPQSQGCQSGDPVQGFQFYKTNGVTLEKNYPYAGVQQECKKPQGEFRHDKYSQIPDDGTGANLKAALQRFPVVVCFDLKKLQNYRSGILDENGCSKIVNYCGLLVGFDAQAWIVKVNLGTLWGEEGYIRIKMGSTCGILQYAIQSL